MEDGLKQNEGGPTEAKTPGKAGWLKKCSGRFLGAYKDRYVLLRRSEMAIYENEDLQKCLEKLALENYEKCHELRSPFKKKNRLVLIRASGAGNKVQDVKLQAHTPEEKEAWINVLSEAINSTKKNIFDEVKVDGTSLDHVTRTRPKGQQNRRLPTRIHLREVANVTSNGILRLDLDSASNVDTLHFETDAAAPNNAVKPPMPPSKLAGTSKHNPGTQQSPQHKDAASPSMDDTLGLVAEEEPHHKDTLKKEEDSRNCGDLTPNPVHKDLKPPMPPSKDKKPRQVMEEEKNCYVEGLGESSEDILSLEKLSSASEETTSNLKSYPDIPKKAIKALELKTVPPGVETSVNGESSGANPTSFLSPFDETEKPSPHSEKMVIGQSKSASMGDLLPLVENGEEAMEKSVASWRRVIGELRDSVAQEVENTKKLLGALCPGDEGRSSPAELLSKALGKLQKADQFLREAEDLEGFESLDKNNKRTSW